MVIFSLCWVSLNAHAQVIDRPGATVNLTRAEFISVKQLQQRISQYEALIKQGVRGLPTDPLVVLDSMVQEVLLKQAADESKIYVSKAQIDAQVAQIRGRLEQQQGRPVTDQQFAELVFRETGEDLEAYYESVKEQLVTQEYIKAEKRELFDAMSLPSAKEIEDRYRKNATSFTNPEMVRISEIIFDTRTLSGSAKQTARQRAEDAQRALENGADTFDNLVLQYSDDPKSKYSKGDRGFFARNDPRIQLYGNIYFDSIFEISIGETSSVIESKVGYHIVKITDHRDAKILTLEDPINPLEKTTVKDFIANLIMQEKQSAVLQQALKEIVEELKLKAEIRIFEENLNF